MDGGRLWGLLGGACDTGRKKTRSECCLTDISGTSGEVRYASIQFVEVGGVDVVKDVVHLVRIGVDVVILPESDVVAEPAVDVVLASSSQFHRHHWSEAVVGIVMDVVHVGIISLQVHAAQSVRIESALAIGSHPFVFDQHIFAAWVGRR